MRARPLSPHLSIYRMSRYTLATSIFNRFTGVGLSVGLLVLVAWLLSVSGGARTYERAREVFASIPLKLLYAAWMIAFCYHLVAGIRHLVWDTGRGLERDQSRRSAAVVVLTSALLVIVLASVVFLGARAR